MAEAAVDKHTNAQPLKYFCHQCSDSVEIKATTDATKLTCPKCESSFIEEMTQELENDHLQTDDPRDGDPLSFLGTSNPSRFLSSMLLSLGSMDHEEDDDIESDEDGLYEFMGGQLPLSLPSQSVGTASASGRNGQQSPFHRFLEQLLGNLRAGNNLSAGQSAEFLPGFSPILQGFHGDPRDYAWGADGIDNIITELLNQTEGTGPPPATKEDIDTLPSTTITQDYVDQATQCSVCLEIFTMGETVKGLPCEHIFHSDCVVPWLQLHRTCPICRKSLGEDANIDEHNDVPPLPTVPEDVTGPTRRLSSQTSSSSNSSIFQDAFEESQQHAVLSADNFMEADLFDDTGSSVDMDN